MTSIFSKHENLLKFGVEKDKLTSFWNFLIPNDCPSKTAWYTTARKLFESGDLRYLISEQGGTFSDLLLLASTVENYFLWTTVWQTHIVSYTPYWFMRNTSEILSSFKKKEKKFGFFWKSKERVHKAPLMEVYKEG